VGTIGRHARVAVALLVVGVLGGNIAVVASRSSSAEADTVLALDRSPVTTEAPVFDEGIVKAAAEPIPVAPAVPAAAPVKRVEVSRHDNPRDNVPDKAPKPKPAPSNKPIVGMLDGPDIEGYARYEGQSTCDPTPKPGTVAIRNLLLSRYPQTQSFGIGRGCEVGGKSEHKEGRAFDWGVNVNNPAQRAAAEDFIAKLLATDSYGHKHALVRRMGIMYIIWNQQIWASYKHDAGWQPYSGDSPHTDHVHISLSWAGARAETSYYSGKVVPGLPDGSPQPPRTDRPRRSTTTTTRRPRPTTTTTTRPPRSTTTTRPPTTTTSSTSTSLPIP
jgi:hypothetical protein